MKSCGLICLDKPEVSWLKFKVFLIVLILGLEYRKTFAT